MADIVITRPSAAAYASAICIKKLGHKPHILPLVEIVPLEFTPPDRDFEGLLATSAHAFSSPRALEQFPKSVERFSGKNCGKTQEREHFIDCLSETKNALAKFQSLPLFCVGNRTAQAAKEAGFRHITAIGKNAAELIDILDGYSPCHFLYLAGQLRRPILEQQLRARGHRVSALEIYQQRPIFPVTDRLPLSSMRFDAALFYCATAAGQAMCLASFFDATTRFLCLSSRIAAALPPALQSRAFIAAHPNEKSLLTLL